MSIISSSSSPRDGRQRGGVKQEMDGNVEGTTIINVEGAQAETRRGVAERGGGVVCGGESEIAH